MLRWPSTRAAKTAVMEVKLREASQFFNSMDPSPFNEKDLDADAEEFIVSWSEEFPLHQPVSLVVHLPAGAMGGDCELIGPAVHHFFGRKEIEARRAFHRLLRDGRISLAIGLTFLFGCLGLGEVLGQLESSPLVNVVSESVAIVGWVAMWRPLEIYLYDWWPLVRQMRNYRRLKQMPVEVRCEG